MTNILLFQLGLTLHWTAQISNTEASLRGLCAVSGQVVWASGTKGTFVTTTDGGLHWRAGTVAGAETLDFRDVEGFDANNAFLLASGEGSKSRVYRTSDGGAHWELSLTNPDAQGFFDSLAFWDMAHGILVGDPVDGHFAIFITADGGKTWQRRRTPDALSGEGAFAASGTSIVTMGTKDAWFGTGGPAGGRVFRTNNGGSSWRVAKAPLGGTKTAGVFSLALLSKKNAIAVGGDYKSPHETRGTMAMTHDGGKTWDAVGRDVVSFRSCVAVAGESLIAAGTDGSDVSKDGGKTWRHFSDVNLNAVAGKAGIVWAVGPNGTIMKLERERER